MKPRLFIGSSVEALNVSNALQENLHYDAEVTIWTQGVFELSSNILDDLLDRLSKTDFAVFVFKHDDMTKIRSGTVGTVRDNVIFELGLFIGRLGRNNVFFVIPEGEKNDHLPTDLLGMVPGYYDEKRSDDNILAALGPFCNQIRRKLDGFVFENLNDLINESREAKILASKKGDHWEYLLFCQMLEDRLVPINNSYQELDRGLLIVRTRVCSPNDFKNICQELINDMRNLIDLFSKLLLEESQVAFGPPGVPGKVLDIKNLADKFVYLCKELLSWEYRLQELHPPSELARVKEIMKKWPRALFGQLNLVSKEMRRVIKVRIDSNGQSTEKMGINFKVVLGQNDANELIACLQNYFS